MYSKDDWLNDRFYSEPYFDGSPVRNDSEKYLKLVSDGKMTHDTLNEIQDAQAECFDKIINDVYNVLKERYRSLILKAPDMWKKLKRDIKTIKEFFSSNEIIYKDITHPILHRGIKKGAKYVTAQQYLNIVINKENGYIYYNLTNNDDNECIDMGRPFLQEWLYYKAEVNLKWLLFLENEKLKHKKKAPDEFYSEQPIMNTIIPDEYIKIIYNNYEGVFKGIEESKELWCRRFILDDPEKIKPIKTSKYASEGSSRLYILAILAAIQKATGGNFLFEEFVLNRFGIKAYQKAKKDHEDKETYRDTLSHCKNILKEILTIQ